MNTRYNIKKLLVLLLSILVIVLLFIVLFLKKDNNIIDNKKLGEGNNDIQEITSGTHMGKDLNDILSEDNFVKVGINPNDFETFKDFLDVFKNYENLDVDPLNEIFVIGIKDDEGATTYIPFDFKRTGDNFDNKINKNLAILDIHGAYKEDSVFGGKDSNSGKKILFGDDFKHPQTGELNKILGLEVNIYNYRNELEKTDNLSQEKGELLSYLYDLEGEYKTANEKRKEQCNKGTCEVVPVNLSGKVIDAATGGPVAGAFLELLNAPEYNTITDENGEYSLDFTFSRFAHLRFKTSKPGYSDGYDAYSLNMFESPFREANPILDFYMYNANDKISIADDNVDKYLKGPYYLVEVDYSKYFIPRDGLYYLDGTKYNGNNIDIYTYQFTKWTNMTSLLENDTFDPIYGYVGNIMKTFGMPYIQFFDRDKKEELFVMSSNPMILQNQVYHMQELYDDYDRLYGPITKEDMEYLYKYSEENEGYPIDFDFLTSNNFLRWPARWSLDRRTGVWKNVGQRLLNVDGLVELPFYSIKDN